MHSRHLIWTWILYFGFSHQLSESLDVVAARCKGVTLCKVQTSPHEALGFSQDMQLQLRWDPEKSVRSSNTMGDQTDFCKYHICAKLVPKSHCLYNLVSATIKTFLFQFIIYISQYVSLHWFIEHDFFARCLVTMSKSQATCFCVLSFDTSFGLTTPTIYSHQRRY